MSVAGGVPAKPVGKLRALSRHLPALLGVCLLVGAIYVVQKEFRHLKLADVQHALGEIPRRALLLSFGWTVVAYFILTFYDRLGTVYAGHTVRYRRAAFASFCAYALSHNLGFPAVSGAAVRYRLYAQWGLTPVQIAKTVAFCSLTFGLGGMVLGGAILFLEPRAVPFFGDKIPPIAMAGIGLFLWAVVVAYLALAKIIGTIRLFGHVVELPKWRMALIQVLLATVDVAATATIFYSLLPPVPGLTWARFLGIYLASYAAGLAANLPGGLGVFDTAMLLGLAPYMDAPRVVGAILVFRLYYYIIPLFLAGSMFAGNEVLLRGRGLLRPASAPLQLPEPTAARAAASSWSEPDFAVAAATGFVVMCGAVLLLLSVLAPMPDFSWIDPDFADVADQAGAFVPSLIGAGLLVVASGLANRVTLAWGATIVLLMAGAVFTAAQGERLWIPGVLTLTAALLVPFRASFYRPSRLFAGPLALSTAFPLFALILSVLALGLSERHVRFMESNSFWEVLVAPGVPNSVRATIGLTVLLGMGALYRLLRPGRVTFLPFDQQARSRLPLGALSAAGGHADGVVMGEAEQAAIVFRRVGRVLLGLGDPTGPRADRVSAVWRLRDLAHQEGLHAAIWRAGPELLKVYGDIGLTALPLGADGLPLPPSQSDAPQALHYLVCAPQQDLATLLPLLPKLAAERVGVAA